MKQKAGSLKSVLTELLDNCFTHYFMEKKTNVLSYLNNAVKSAAVSHILIESNIWAYTCLLQVKKTFFLC